MSITCQRCGEKNDNRERMCGVCGELLGGSAVGAPSPAKRRRHFRGPRIERHEIGNSTVVKMMEMELQNMAIGLLIMGVMAILLHRVLNPYWGGVLVILGVIALLYKRLAMFVVIGISLIIAALWNILGAVIMHDLGWVIFGLVQIFWAVLEFIRYKYYRKLI